MCQVHGSRNEPKNETPQTQRVVGRSPEQPSPKCCSRRNLRSGAGVGNGTKVPVLLSSRKVAIGVECGKGDEVLEQAGEPGRCGEQVKYNY
jgi:hypothetical protein